MHFIIPEVVDANQTESEEAAENAGHTEETIDIPETRIKVGILNNSAEANKIMNNKSIKNPMTSMDMIQQVAATLAIENMFMDDEIKKNLVLIANNQLTSEDVIKELDRRYA